MQTISHSRKIQFHPTQIEESLSLTQLKVFKLLGCGYETALIAQECKHSVRTTECFFEQIKQKLNLDSRHEMTAAASRYLTLKEFNIIEE